MEKQNKKQLAEFESLLEKIRKALLWASMYFDIRVQLWPTEQMVNVLNRYRGFFRPVVKALFDQFTIVISELVSSGIKAPSFHRIFRMLDKNPDLAPGIDVRSLRRRLKQHRKSLEAIDDYRDTLGAHLDTTIVAQSQPIVFGEVARTLKELQDIFNEITHTRKQLWSFKPLQHSNTQLLIEKLKSI